MKELVKRIFLPNKILGFILFNISFGLLIYVFVCHLEETLVAYISYILSAYALTIFCIWLYKVCQFSNNYIKENSKIYKIYKENNKIITKISMILSSSLNLIYGVFKLILGLYYRSAWLITFAIYYLLLCFMKSSLVMNVEKDNFGKNIKKEYKKLKHTGVILLFLNIILVGMVILIICQNQTIIYPGYLIFIVAMYDFYLIINAFINLFKYRKQNSPILIASKCINLTVAMISMVSLEVAMVSHFGNNDVSYKQLMTGIMSFAICFINSFMSIYMIVKSSKKIKE